MKQKQTQKKNMEQFSIFTQIKYDHRQHIWHKFNGGKKFGFFSWLLLNFQIV